MIVGRVFGGLAVLTAVMAWHSGAVAAVGPVRGTAVIDGHKSPGEWDAAAQIPIFTGPFAGSRLYVMNDRQNLYFAVDVVGDADLGSTDSIGVRFDQTLDGVLTVNDDTMGVSFGNGSDGYYTGSQYTPDPVRHTKGAVQRAGSNNFFEMSKPLNSGDVRDLAVAAPAQIGFCVVAYVNNSNDSRLIYPTNCSLTVNQQTLYDRLTLARAPLRAEGRAVVDGIASPGEWDQAASWPIFAGPQAGSRLYLMNDRRNLYVAVEVSGDTNLDASDGMSVRFDNTLDGVVTLNDDVIGTSTTGVGDSHFGASGIQSDAVVHGAGVVRRTGASNFFEFSKPLASGDTQDFDLDVGSEAGICVYGFVNGGSSSQISYPAGCYLAINQQTLYDTFEIARAALTGKGVATIDGVKSPGEWSGADTARIFFGPYAGSILHVMNDRNNLYLGIEVRGDATLGSDDGFLAYFDNSLDRVPTPNDDSPSIFQSGTRDRFYNGVTYVTDAVEHGVAAAGRSGGVNFFELAKPLMSGDTQDFSLAVGDRVGLCLYGFVDNVGRELTSHPRLCYTVPNEQARFDLVEIGPGPEPVTALSTPRALVLSLGLLVVGALVAARSRRARVPPPATS